MIIDLTITAWDKADTAQSPLHEKLRRELTDFLLGFKDRHPGTHFGINQKGA